MRECIALSKYDDSTRIFYLLLDWKIQEADGNIMQSQHNWLTRDKRKELHEKSGSTYRYSLSVFHICEFLAHRYKIQSCITVFIRHKPNLAKLIYPNASKIRDGNEKLQKWFLDLFKAHKNNQFLRTSKSSTAVTNKHIYSSATSWKLVYTLINNFFLRSFRT
jgi:hypothetical protein